MLLSTAVLRVSGADARMSQVRPQSHRAYYNLTERVSYLEILCML